MSHFPRYVLLIDELRAAWTEETREHRLALTVIILIGIAVRAVYLAQPMRYDEAVTYMYFVRLDWSDALSTYTYPNNHLFHTALAKAATSLFGNSPAVLRVPVFVAGCLLPLTTYLMGRALYDGGAALIGSGLTAASGALILYSTNARGYAIVAVAFTLLVLQAVRLQRGAPSHEWLVFAAIAALGLWTIPTMLFPLGAVVLWIVLGAATEGRLGEIRPLWIALALAGIATALLYAPVVSREGLPAITRNRFVVPMGWFPFLGDLERTWLDALSSWSLGIPPLVGVMLLGLSVIALVRHAQRSRFAVGLPIAVFVWCCWLLVVTHRAPFPRVWLWMLPLAACLAGVGTTMLMRAWRGGVLSQRAPLIAIAMSAMLSTSVVFSRAVSRSTDTGTYADAAAATERLATILRPGDRILAAIPTNAPLMYYMHQRGLDVRYLSVDEDSARRIIAVVDAAEGQRLDAIVARSAVRDSTRFFAPEVVARFPTSMLVAFRRRDVPPT